MIHPINLPEELLASNPQRPSLFELRGKPRITYGENGRRLLNGMPTSPRSVNNLWESALVRGFVHRMAYDVKAEVEETSSVESMIDVIDLHPIQAPSSPQEQHSPQTTDRSERYSVATKKDAEIEPQFGMSFHADGDILQDNSDGRGLQIVRRSSAQFRKTKSSAYIGPEIFSPILQPCCSSLELHNHLLKEFLRFDFSNSKVFSDLCEKVCKTEKGAENGCDDDFDFDDDEEITLPPRKTSIELLPGTIGSRIWFNKPLSKSNSIGPNFDQSFSRSCSGSRPKLCFSIESICVANDILNIQILAFNSNPRPLRLETSLHLHSAKGQTIGQRFLTKEKIFNFQDSEENILKFKLNLNKEYIKNICLESDEYIVITLLGHIHV